MWTGRRKRLLRRPKKSIEVSERYGMGMVTIKDRVLELHWVRLYGNS